MNPLAVMFMILGVLIIIMAIKGSYKNITKDLKKL